MTDARVQVIRNNAMTTPQQPNLLTRKFGHHPSHKRVQSQSDEGVALHLDADSDSNSDSKTKKTQKKTQKSKNQDMQESSQIHATRQWKIIAVGLWLFSLLLLLALISYTSADQANAELRLRDVAGIIRGDEFARARADVTQNWLGLVGAVVANFLYNHTYGISTLVLPFLIAWWSKHLFVQQTIPYMVMKRTAAAIALGVLLSGIFGVMQVIYWFPAPPLEFSGAIGQFLANVCSDFLGKTGAFLLLAAAFATTLFVGGDLDFDRAAYTLVDWAKKIYSMLKTIIVNAKETRRTAISATLQDDIPAIEDTESVTAAPLHRTTIDEDEPMEILKNAIGSSPKEEVVKEEIPAARHTAPISTPAPQIRKPEAEEISEQTFKPMTTHTDLPPQRYPAPLHPTPESGSHTAERTTEQLKSEAGIVALKNSHSQLPTPSPISSPIEMATFVEQNKVQESENNTISAQSVKKDDYVHPEKHTPELLKTAPLQVFVNEMTTAPDETATHLQPENISDDIDYTPPSLTLFAEPPVEDNTVDDAELSLNGRLLQEKLETFKISIENLVVTPGPVVTQYEFVPAAGIKISQIESLADDIALALKARGIRIIAPVPGKGTVGIEIPNHFPKTIYFSSILRNKRFHDADYRLPLALGKTISGEVYIADLAKMPHLLIAGATGAGKSVGVNTMISSLLFRMHPKDLKLVFVDPKKVEMAFYGSLENHFLAICPDIDERIVTTPANAVLMLKSLVAEMEMRYNILASVGQRNIVDYNRKVNEGKYANKDNHDHKPLPYIVVVIDELADLMMTAAREVEEPIARLAQLARAVGIHLIVATQRPSVNVITGYIKANFPARIAYQVASKIDSRTILDMNGADQLLGNGDMLFLPGGAPKPIRLQNSFISTDEVEAMCEFIGDQQGYSQPYTLPSVIEKTNNDRDDDYSSSGSRDALFEDAARVVVTHQQGSVSLLQRRLKVGYARAARIMDELEEAGVVGSFDGSKARSVLAESLSDLEALI